MMMYAWLVYADQQGITSRTCGKGGQSWEARRWKWVSARYEIVQHGHLLSDHEAIKTFAMLSALTKLRSPAEFTHISKWRIIN